MWSGYNDVFQDDPLCVERSVDEDGCCVVVLCASHTPSEAEDPCEAAQCGPNAECKREVITGSSDLSDLDSASENTICVCREGYTGDPDSDLGCSLTSSLEDSLDLVPEDACVTQNSTYQPGETWYDGCDYKCSCNNKEILCESRCKIITENLDSRSGCELSPDPDDSCCQVMVCPSRGESYPNVSILQPSLPSDGCQFKNETYSKEERWYDGCEQQCQCMGFGDVFCLPRCQPTKPELGEDCYTLPDVTDTCCNVTVCDKPKHEVPDVVKIQSEEVSAPSVAVLEKQPRLNDLPAASEGEVFIGQLQQMHHGVEGRNLNGLNRAALIILSLSRRGVCTQ